MPSLTSQKVELLLIILERVVSHSAKLIKHHRMIDMQSYILFWSCSHCLEFVTKWCTQWVEKLHHFIFATLCQTKIYFDNFWHTHTPENFERSDIKIINLSWTVSL